METAQEQKQGKAKTKFITVDGTRRRIPAESYSLENIIARGVALQRQIDELSEQLKTVKEEAYALGLTRMGDRHSLTMLGIAGSVEVRINPDEVRLDEDQAGDLRPVLGDQFDVMFDKKVEYKINRKGRTFLEKASEATLQAIQSCARNRKVPPTIRFRYEHTESSTEE